MEYIINGVVKYNSSDGTLFCLDKPMEMLTLTRLSSELLLFLIKNNGTSVSRDSILNELWEKKGLNASSNNLNNYISILRKALTQYGCPDLIATIPKYGFSFEAEITPVTHEQMSENQESEPIRPLAITDAKRPVKVNQKSGHNLKPVWVKSKPAVAALLLCTLAILCLPSLYSYLSLQSLRTEIFSIDQCRFYLLGDKSKNMDKFVIMEKIRTTINKEKLNCNIQANLYYYSIDRLDLTGRQLFNQTIAYCPKNNHVQCNNYYLSDKETENEN